MLLWFTTQHKSIELCLHYGHTFFDCYIRSGIEPCLHFTAFYGSPHSHNKDASWTLLKRLADVAPHLPWLAIGDFNEIISNANKSGGGLRNESQMETFRKVLDHCSLHETPFEGEPFTWIKNHFATNTIKERLDWCFVNSLWGSTFSIPTVQHHDYYSSDHRAISATITPMDSTVQQEKRRSRFRFEKLWLSDPECKDLIINSWNTHSHADPIQTVLLNLDSCATSLQKWHQHKYGSMKKNIAASQARVSALNNLNHRSQDTMNELQRTEVILDDLLEQEEIYWQQRSRVDWLNSGDRNTKFFHAKASARKSNNKIKSLLTEAGDRVHSKTAMAAAIHDYFASIFSADTIDEEALSQTLNAIPNMVTDDMNDELTKPFRAAEIESALHSMALDKSPGIDGMSSMFYQQNWSVVGEAVTTAVLSVLNDGADPTSLNKTIITLIPKIKNPQWVQDYRPISLCNVISKLVTKVLVGRFKNVLPIVISETQSAFLPNRLITDNILVAFELVHAIKNKTAGRCGVATLKLDMSKAFDRVEWRFIKEVMTKMNFSTKWIDSIMGCLTTNTFTFLLNSEVTGSLTPSKGLRQGCPLSPYLFLICSEGLSRLLHYEQSEGHLQGFKLTRQAPPISHLLFADDSLLFCQATESSCLAIKRVLDLYHRASGQVLNPEKSVMSFSPNTTLAAQVFFHRTLSMPICECHEKYLGLPSYSGRDKKEMFSGIKEKIWRLMHTWNEKIFSAGGREVLLKAVVQSIPTYAMSCFRLPMYFCNQVESMMANFWWGMNENGSKIHWRSWKLLCQRKDSGGMGFRSFVHFNQALLAKQAWRLHAYPDTLLAKLLKSRYYSQNSFLEANPGHSPSLTWQGIHWGKQLLSSGLRWKIGEGCRVLCATDPWIPGNSTFLPFHYEGPINGVVSNLIKENREWDIGLLQQWFSQPDVDRILTIPLSFFRNTDTLAWHHHSSGIYTVQTGYHLASSLADVDDCSSSLSQSSWWKFFWALQLPQKVKIFAWRVFNDALPVATALVKRKIITDSTCSICRQAWETVGHAFFGCKYAKAMWKFSGFTFDWSKASSMHKGDYLIHLSNLHSQAELEQIICNLWSLWTKRNRVVHGHKAKSAKELSLFATNYMLHFRSAQLKYQQSPQISGASTATNSAPHTASCRPNVPWKTPPSCVVKLNIDAAVDRSTKVTGLGAVFRDSMGMVVAAFSKKLLGSFEPHEMEALALFHGVHYALHFQFPQLQIETDALRVKNALYIPTAACSTFNDIIMDVSSLLSFFPNVNVSHVKRTANTAAHGLAKFALGVDEDCFWSDCIPPPINSVIVNDSMI
uniref:Reverse transcriptase domain-containing protein n=1 Tax=Cannabis sativa TaxID=3483 RepID=A0A803QG78_CANSA